MDPSRQQPALENQANAPTTILVIEDEDAVREMLQITLERSGFRVLVASGGGEALDLCEASAAPIDLVLTDIVMPGTNGTDLASYLAIRYPWMRTVRMSGFTEAMLGESGLRRDDSLFLQKPFCREELLVTVRNALNRQAPE
jgi:two-component system cell cycle sensor histidine kinase/response regulator CckA